MPDATAHAGYEWSNPVVGCAYVQLWYIVPVVFPGAHTRLHPCQLWGSLHSLLPALVIGTFLKLSHSVFILLYLIRLFCLFLLLGSG